LQGRDRCVFADYELRLNVGIGMTVAPKPFDPMLVAL
jgi:hypothetical protein